MSDSSAIRVVHEFTQTNEASPERVFPLLCPVREAEWVPGWKYRLIYSKSGFAEEGCVFSTPEDDGAETIWQCTLYDPQRFQISFSWVRPGLLVSLLNIRLQPIPPGKTSAHIRYAYTALSDAGQKELQRMDRDWFEHKMKSWESAINHYLKTGTCLTAPAWK